MGQVAHFGNQANKYGSYAYITCKNVKKSTQINIETIALIDPSELYMQIILILTQPIFDMLPRTYVWSVSTEETFSCNFV